MSETVWNKANMNNLKIVLNSQASYFPTDKNKMDEKKIMEINVVAQNSKVFNKSSQSSLKEKMPTSNSYWKCGWIHQTNWKVYIGRLGTQVESEGKCMEGKGEVMVTGRIYEELKR